MKITARISVDTAVLLRRRGLGDSGKVRLAIAETAARLAETYIPRDTGFLAQSVEIAADGGELRYTAPYAAAQYYGRFRNYTNNASGLRGGYWAERMAADKRRELTAAVAQAICEK